MQREFSFMFPRAVKSASKKNARICIAIPEDLKIKINLLADVRYGHCIGSTSSLGRTLFEEFVESQEKLGLLEEMTA